MLRADLAGYTLHLLLEIRPRPRRSFFKRSLRPRGQPRPRSPSAYSDERLIKSLNNAPPGKLRTVANAKAPVHPCLLSSPSGSTVSRLRRILGEDQLVEFPWTDQFSIFLNALSGRPFVFKNRTYSVDTIRKVSDFKRSLDILSARLFTEPGIHPGEIYPLKKH